MGEMDHKDSYCCDECCEGNMRVLGAGLDGAGKGFQEELYHVR